MPSSTSDPRSGIRAAALAAGFDAVRFAGPDAPPRAGDALMRFLDAGCHGTMEWMARNAARRADPRALWPDVRSIVLVAANYGPDVDPLAGLAHRSNGLISVYARGADYHDVLKKRLKRLGAHIAAEFDARVKVFVDTAPVMEKPLAQAAGLGWQGKHTNLVSRDFGSWLFLGSIFTTMEIDPDEAEADHCGKCHACLDVCPTGAFPAPYQLDARRCISYLTIEHRGTIAREFREAMGNRIYGCDDCLAVCPWNKFATISREIQFRARDELRNLRLADLARLDDAAFRALFRGSPIKRTGRDRFVRNVLIAIGNSADRSLIPATLERLDDASPLVRAMAVWALSRLLSRDEFSALARDRQALETDMAVREEWDTTALPERAPASP